MCTVECASFKKTCLLERVTSQWRYGRGKSEGNRRKKRNETDQRNTRKRERGRENRGSGTRKKWEENQRKVSSGSVSGSLEVEGILYIC